MATVQRLAEEILRKLDDDGADLSVSDWRELCDEVAQGAKDRLDASREMDG